MFKRTIQIFELSDALNIYIIQVLGQFTFIEKAMEQPDIADTDLWFHFLKRFDPLGGRSLGHFLLL